MIKSVFFDMNETLLDLNLLQSKFAEYFDNVNVMKYWFTQLLHSSIVIAAMNNYIEFGTLALSVLESVASEYNVVLNEKDLKDILSTFKDLAPHKDVKEALRLLRANDIQVTAVSNSSLAMMKEQLTNANIINLFDSYYSVDSVKKYKPFAPIYHYVTMIEGLDNSEVFMVATHDWDLYGAKNAGLNTAYVKRKNSIYNPNYLQSDIFEDNLVDTVKSIINLNQTN
ncbi:MAG: haloacid dehalogenase type II [Spirochaetaceae bacterium]|nr:haloacid dehalogenase type II [Spirochaetaceae bacterium]